MPSARQRPRRRSRWSSKPPRALLRCHRRWRSPRSPCAPTPAPRATVATHRAWRGIRRQPNPGRPPRGRREAGSTTAFGSLGGGWIGAEGARTAADGLDASMDACRRSGAISAGGGAGAAPAGGATVTVPGPSGGWIADGGALRIDVGVIDGAIPCDRPVSPPLPTFGVVVPVSLAVALPEVEMVPVVSVSAPFVAVAPVPSAD